MTEPNVERPDTEDMLMIHASFRREFRLAPELVRATRPDDTARAQRVAAHLDLVATSLAHHHAGEDAVLWPALRATGRVEPGLLDDMLGEHHQLAADLDALGQDRRAWADDPSGARSERLIALLGRLGTEVGQHLDHEEAETLPLVRAHLTIREWDALADESRRRLPRNPRDQLLLLGVLLEDATPEQRAGVLDSMPAPARLIWRWVGLPYYRRYVARLRRAAA